MWRLSAHSGTLWRLYAFKEASLEARYQAQSRARCLVPIRFHCCVVLAYLLVSLLSYLGAYHFPGFAWLYVGVGCLTILLLPCTYVSGGLLPGIVPLYTGYCCLVGAVNAYVLFMEPDALKSEAMHRSIPELLHLSLTDAPDLLPHIDRYLTQLLFSYTFLLSLLKTCAIWVALSLGGLHGYSACAYAATTLSLAACVAAVPGNGLSEWVGDVAVTLVVGGLFFCVCAAVERARRSAFLAETLLEKELRSSQQADSILNHTLKNTLADVAANLEVFLAGQAGPSLLQDCIACLRRGMRSCKQRQVYLQLVAGGYVPAMNEVNLRDFAEELVAGRRMACTPLDMTVHLDHALLNLILENAGHLLSVGLNGYERVVKVPRLPGPGEQPVVGRRPPAGWKKGIRSLLSALPSPLSIIVIMSSFNFCTKPRPDGCPLSRAVVPRSHGSPLPVGRHNTRRLTPQLAAAHSDPNVCLAVRDVTDAVPRPPLPGWRRLQFSVTNVANPERPPLTVLDTRRLFSGQLDFSLTSVAPTLSDRIGISHCVMAARLAGIALSLTQEMEGGTVTFTASLDVQAVPAHATAVVGKGETQRSNHEAEAFPPGLHFLCIDDSAGARRLLELHLKQWCAPGSVTCLGALEEDVEKFVPKAMEDAHVVIIDQHLDFSHVYHGTDLVAQLLDLGFRGLICVRSANDSPEDRRWYTHCGAHCVFGKDMLGRRMVQELKIAYVQLQRSTPTAPFSPSGPHTASSPLDCEMLLLPEGGSPHFGAFPSSMGDALDSLRCRSLPAAPRSPPPRRRPPASPLRAWGRRIEPGAAASSAAPVAQP